MDYNLYFISALSFGIFPQLMNHNFLLYIYSWKLYRSEGIRSTRIEVPYSEWEQYTSTGVAGPNMAVLPGYNYTTTLPYQYYELSVKIWRWGQNDANHGE